MRQGAGVRAQHPLQPRRPVGTPRAQDLAALRAQLAQRHHLRERRAAPRAYLHALPAQPIQNGLAGVGATTYCLTAPAAMPAIKWRWATRKATITGIAATTMAAIVSFKVGASWPMKARPTCSVRISGLGAMMRGHRSWSQLCRNVSSARVAIAG